MKKVLLTLVVVLAAVVSFAGIGGTREIERKVPTLDDGTVRTNPVGRARGVIGPSDVTGQVTPDTFYYGGTVIGLGGVPYAAEPSAPGWVNRKMWTWSANGFAGTLHSGLNMDGWVGVDNTIDTAKYFRVMDAVEIGGCVIAGEKSLFCGVTNAECAAQCYADRNGTGYGNNWEQVIVTPSFHYSTGSQITLTYAYSNDTEEGYDFTKVTLELYDAGTGGWNELRDAPASYSGRASGTETIDVDSCLTGAGAEVDFRIKFSFDSDGSYSDEDGRYVSSCGAVAFDNVALTGDVAFSEDFEDVETGCLPLGWQKLADGVGDFAKAMHLNDLPIGLSQDPCVAGVPGLCEIADSVIVICDVSSSYPHPVGQSNYVVSPVIDLSNHPGLSGKILQVERLADLPMWDMIFMYWQVRYGPICESGGWSAWLSDDNIYYVSQGTTCSTFSLDVSAYVPPNAQRAQMAMGVVNFCDLDPWDGCSYVSNVTPYFDNATFGVYGSVAAPYISMREYDYWQDQFAEDGTLNPTSTADTRTATWLSYIMPPIFGDTLVCRGTADNMEVYFVFRMARVGPGLSLATGTHGILSSVLSSDGWSEARMDTAEITDASGTSTVVVSGYWMCTRHEKDVTRILYGLPEGTEILPNNVLVPGTRIEYFLKARYAGSDEWFLLPDTTGGRYEEFEILPTMRDDGQGSVEWPCLIVADHFGQRGNSFERNSERISHHLRANNLDFDMFNRLAPASNMRNGLARWAVNPGQSGTAGDDKFNWGPGATLFQMQGYTHCILDAGDIYSYSVYETEVDMLTTWLVNATDSQHPRFFWLSGDQVVRELNRNNWGKPFLSGTLCATCLSSSYALQNNDYTYCLPMNCLAGGRVVCGGQEAYILRANGCPMGTGRRTVIGVSSSPGCNAVAEIQYDSRVPSKIAAVSNAVSVEGGSNYKTFTEGYDFCQMRTDTSQGLPACGPDGFITTWVGYVLGWANYSASVACNNGEVVGTGALVLPSPVITSLSHAFPNPMNPTAEITYTIGKSGKVLLRILDVSGHVVRILVNQYQEATPEPYKVTWDGKNECGLSAASGVFFYQLEAPGYRSAKKIVILR